MSDDAGEQDRDRVWHLQTAVCSLQMSCTGSRRFTMWTDLWQVSCAAWHFAFEPSLSAISQKTSRCKLKLNSDLRYKKTVKCRRYVCQVTITFLKKLRFQRTTGVTAGTPKLRVFFVNDFFKLNAVDLHICLLRID